MNKQKICIVSQSHLCNNPRVLKEAITLTDAGYAVSILTAIYSDDLYQQDMTLIKGKGIQYEPYSDLRNSGLAAFKQRLMRKIAVWLQSAFKIESLYSLGYAPSALKKKLNAIQASLYIMHQEMATVAGSALLKDHNVAFDLEDWYSEDLLPEARAKRPIALLKKAETAALKNGIYCITTSAAMARKLADTYKSDRPDVIYNAFPTVDDILAEKQFNRPLKLFWFSQTIGAGRGLEEFITLLKHVSAALELHLLGNVAETYRESLIISIPKQHRLIFHNIVSNRELPAKIAEFDIGLALELASPPSRNYTITNKFFQYIESGLPVIATETAGQMEMFGQFTPGLLLPQSPSAGDINKLIQWLGDIEGLKQSRQQALEAARFFGWKQQAQRITHLVEQALETSR